MQKSLKITVSVILLIIVSSIIIWILISSSRTKQKRAEILCLGDSLTASKYGDYPRYLQKLSLKKGFKKKVVSFARPGNTSGEYLRFFKDSLLLNKYQPEMVLLMLGTNDVRVDGDHTELEQYIQNMNRIIQHIKSHRNSDHTIPTIFIATIPPIYHIDLHTFDESSKIRVITEINPAIKKLAARHNLELVDIYTMFRKNPNLLPGIHPTKTGYYRIAKKFLTAILRIQGSTVSNVTDQPDVSLSGH
jgi:lysophospholipase L1-like esterase